MQRFTRSIRAAINHRCWYVALSSALTLPDVCGRLMEPAEKSSEKRYANWFREWMQPLYTSVVPGEGERIFLSGSDCYALRCSYLHEGGGDITNQRARKALEKFHFISPAPPPLDWKLHRNLLGGTVLQLQVDLFCLEMADAVERWSQSVIGDAVIQERMQSLLVIYSHAPGLPELDWGEYDF
ncbi:MAG: hypothetical protein E6Q70_17265 [Pseudomonas monteilii]|nr:MAG: hypothetical protein E6Q70_17265 [Pseudomonas monteilii]